MTQESREKRCSKVLIYGSLNLDHVYEVDHIVSPGETIASKSLQTFCGGKGLNQAIAFAKAGAETYIAGKIGRDGETLNLTCEQYGVHTDFLVTCDSPSGSAVIQVDRNGQNSILLFGGANQKQSKAEIDETIKNFEKGDFLVLQNEINELTYLIGAAQKRGMEIVLNPSPYHPDLLECGLQNLSWLILNEVEAFQMTGKERVAEILESLNNLCPSAKIVLTMGKEDAVCRKDNKIFKQTCYRTQVIDTTAAGDTFTGYFFAEILKHGTIEKALDMAARAASITVSRTGAAEAIPCLEEVFDLYGGERTL